jgi:16S rRNA processing protein RimM
MKIDYVKAGRILKTHGYSGELKIKIDNEVKEFLSLETLFLLEEAKFIPYFVDDCYLISDDHAILKIDGIATKEDAQKIAGRPFYLNSKDLVIAEKAQSKLIGWQVTDKSCGMLGEITDILEFPNQKMVQVDFKEKPILFPLVDDYLLKKDEQNQVLHVDLPEGLIDL